MKVLATILTILFFASKSNTSLYAQSLNISYFGDTLTININGINKLALNNNAKANDIIILFKASETIDTKEIIQTLIDYKKSENLDDWFFYQLIRKTAQALCSKTDNYDKYTFYKWYLLAKCGYNTQLAFLNDKLLFYVQSNDEVFELPLFRLEDKQYVCLNRHDFTTIDFEKNSLEKINLPINNAKLPFSYSINNIPNFKSNLTKEKALQFNYNDSFYVFEIKLNVFVDDIFKNYPSLDYKNYFNTPISNITSASLLPKLKQKTSTLSQQEGLAYLMNFTRYAFLYKSDDINFGVEKRLTPEQTLIQNYSDCDDRVGLFYYLVKEIYNLPMIVLVYPKHIVLAVELPIAIGNYVTYNNKQYTLCEPTSQSIDLPLGQVMPNLNHAPYNVVYVYNP